MEKKKFEFEKLTLPANRIGKTETVLDKYEADKLTRVTIQVGYELQEKVKDYGYWLGMSQEQVIIEALEIYMKDKFPNPRPDLVKARKIGRPKKR